MQRMKIGKVLFYFFVFLAAFIIMIPFIWTILLSFKDDAEILQHPVIVTVCVEFPQLFACISDN